MRGNIFMKNKRITKPQLAFQYCKEIAKSINECVLRTVALQILRENEEIFLTVKGSDWQHHNYAGGLEMCMFPSYKFHRTYTPLEKATVSSSFVILLLFIFSFSICFYENTDNA